MDFVYLERLKKEALEHYNFLESGKEDTLELIDELFREKPEEIVKRKEEYLEVIADIKNTISEIKDKLKKYYN